MAHERFFAHVAGGAPDVARAPGVDSVPGVLEHRAKGFEPLEDYPVTWDVLWDLWPTEHRAALPETREQPARLQWAAALKPDVDPDVDPDVRLLRSPWPDVPVKRFINVAYQQLAKRHPNLEYERDPTLVATVARDLLAGDPAVLRVRRRRTGPTAGT